ncbi:MAG: hypothetical protein ACOYN2_04205 [Patescibacteria group bacterium]
MNSLQSINPTPMNILALRETYMRQKSSSHVIDISILSYFKRPYVESLDLSNEQDILRYIAQENAYCLIDDCCADEPEFPEDHIKGIDHVFASDLSSPLLHVEIHADFTEEIQKGRASAAIRYFEVFLRAEPQDKVERERVLALFKEIAQKYKKEVASINTLSNIPRSAFSRL